MKGKNLTKISGGIAAAGAVAMVGAYFLTRSLMHVALNREEPALMKAARKRLIPSSEKGEFLKAVEAKMVEMDALPVEDVELTAADGTRLVGHWYPCDNAKRVILAMHGWRSSWKKDFGMSTEFWHDNGCSVLFAEQRGQNESGGDYMGFGLTERYDCRLWAYWLAEKAPNLPIYLGGISMGATTVLMASCLDLPEQVHGIIADCGFTSPYEIWKHVSNGKVHLPYRFRGKLADSMFLRTVKAGSSHDSAEDALKKTSLPVLFIHGTEDQFVPVTMTYKNYRACAGPKRLLIVPGADHGMSYYVEREKYEAEVRKFWRDFD